MCFVCERSLGWFSSKGCTTGISKIDSESFTSCVSFAVKLKQACFLLTQTWDALLSLTTPGLLPGHAWALILHCKQHKRQRAHTLWDALSQAEQIRRMIMPCGRTQTLCLISLAGFLTVFVLTTRKCLEVCINVNTTPMMTSTACDSNLLLTTKFCFSSDLLF